MPDVRPSSTPAQSAPSPELDRLTKLIEGQREIAEAELAGEIEKKGGLFAWIFKPVLEFFKAQFSAVWTQFWKLFTSTFPNLAAVFESVGTFCTPNHFDAFVQGFLDNGWIDEADANALMSIHANAGPFGRMAQIMIQMQLTAKIVGAFGDVIGGTAIQRLNKSFSPAVPGAGEILNVSFIAPELHGKVVEALQRNGYSEDDIKLLFVSRYALHPPGDVGELYLRGVLDEAGAENRLRELGYTDDRIAELKQLWKRIPTLQDIVRYLGKEAFEPDQIAKFGLMSGFPEESVEWAAKQGLDRKWAEAEWVAHWRDPGLSPYLEAFHRGQVSWDDVQQYMRYIEIAPGLQKVIKDTAYSVYTRVDVRRMFKLGVLNEAGVLRSYLDLGYDEEKAANLTKFTIIDVASEDQPITRADIEAGYNDGDLTQAEAEKLLVQIGYNAERAAYLIFRAQTTKEKAARATAQGLLEEKFTGNLIDEGAARAGLLALGLSIARVNELLDGLKVKVQKNAKLPSKTDLDKLLRAKIITQSTYLQEMAKLGYSDTYRQWYLEMIAQGITE